jgi:hypothetical protein
VAIYRAWRQQLQSTLLDDVNPYNRNMDFPAVIGGSNEDDHGSYLTPDSVLYHVLTHAPELADPTVPPPTTLAPSRNYCNGSCAKELVSALTQTVAALSSRFGSSDQSTWHEPVIVSTMSSQGAAPEVTIERMNRGSFNQLHDFGPGSAFQTYDVVPPGQSGMIDLATLLASQASDDPEAAVNEGNPHVFDQKALYVGWRYKPLIQHEGELAGADEEIIPYVRGVVPQPDTAVLRNIYRMLDQAGLSLPNVDLFGEVSTE